MLKVGLIILALIGLVGTTTHYAFANNMGPANGPADSGGGSGGGAGPDTTQSNTDTGPHVDFPKGWLAGNEQYGGPGGYGQWKTEHHHHLWGSNLWLDQRLRNQDYYWNKYMNTLHHHPAHGPSAEEMDPFAGLK